MPMTHFTPQRMSPKKETIDYIKSFARLFANERCNEQEARFMAHLQTATPLGES